MKLILFGFDNQSDPNSFNERVHNESHWRR